MNQTSWLSRTNHIFWSENESGFGQPEEAHTAPPMNPRSPPPPPTALLVISLVVLALDCWSTELLQRVLTSIVWYPGSNFFSIFYFSINFRKQGSENDSQSNKRKKRLDGCETFFRVSKLSKKGRSKEISVTRAVVWQALLLLWAEFRSSFLLLVCGKMFDCV